MQFYHSANADQRITINHLAQESKISYRSGIQTHSDFDGNLMLMQLFLGKKSDELGIFRRKKYRNEIGRRNKIKRYSQAFSFSRKNFRAKKNNSRTSGKNNGFN